MKNSLSALLLFVAASVVPSSLLAGDFSLNVYSGSTNFWSNSLLQVPSGLINGITPAITGSDDDDVSFTGGSYRYQIFKIKEDGDKVKVRNGNYFGFKGKDLFSNVQAGLKFGWAPKISPLGIYISCAYQYRRFEANFDKIGWSTYKLHSIRPGLGIRITPFLGLLENDGWSPIAEVGTSYNYYFKSKGPYNNDTKQFNSGMISTFALGARFSNVSIVAGVEIDHYSLFNKDFTLDGYFYPYADVETRNYTIFFSANYEF